MDGGGGEIGDFVSDMLARIAAQVRDTADAPDTLRARNGDGNTDIVKKISKEMKAPLADDARAGRSRGLSAWTDQQAG